MLLSQRIKPISYLKANAAEILEKLSDHGPLVVTVRGEAKAVLVDVREYEESQLALDLLTKLLASERAFAAGEYRPLDEAIADIKRKSRRP